MYYFVYFLVKLKQMQICLQQKLSCKPCHNSVHTNIQYSTNIQCCFALSLLVLICRKFRIITPLKILICHVFLCCLPQCVSKQHDNIIYLLNYLLCCIAEHYNSLNSEMLVIASPFFRYACEWRMSIKQQKEEEQTLLCASD